MCKKTSVNGNGDGNLINYNEPHNHTINHKLPGRLQSYLRKLPQHSILTKTPAFLRSTTGTGTLQIKNDLK